MKRKWSRMLYFVPDLASPAWDAVWPSVLSAIAREQRKGAASGILLGIKADYLKDAGKMIMLQNCLRQLGLDEAAIIFACQDGILPEMMRYADCFITTKEASSSKGIDYADTLSQTVLSGLEYDIFKDIN